MGRANLYGLLIVPLLAVIALPYALLWGVDMLKDGLVEFFRLRSLLPTLILGTLVHEAVHGVAWMYFGQKPWTSITFGFQVKTLTPFAHCKEPLEVSAYRISAAMPGIVLGIVPAAIATLVGQQWLIWFGLFFTLAAVGDIVILWSLRDVERGKLVEDHPSRAGCYVLEPIP